MNSTGWLVLALIEFPIAFTLGVLVGVKVQHRRLAREVAVQVRVIKVWLDRWLVLIVSLFVILVVVLIYHDNRQHNADVARLETLSKTAATSASQVKHLGECVASYENRLSAALRPVRKATKRNGDADIAFKKAAAQLFIPGDNKRDFARVKKTLHHNIAVFDRLNSERAKNPYPKPPRKVCPK